MAALHKVLQSDQPNFGIGLDKVRLLRIYNSKIPHFYLLFVYAAHHVDHIKDICPVVSLVEKKKKK